MSQATEEARTNAGPAAQPLLQADWELDYYSRPILEADGKKLLGFDSEFHGQLIHHFLGETIYNQSNSGFCIDAALVAIENLVFTNF